jgi:hypothetical protein
MKPVNTKSLLAFVFGQMEKLDNKEIDVDTANAQAKLVQQANNILRSEHERTRVKMELEKHNKEYNSNIEFREVESKNFE